MDSERVQISFALLVHQYLPDVQALLAKHGLAVPASTAEMLAKTIMKSRCLEPAPKGRTLSPRPRLQKADRHARKLLHYLEHGSSRRDSIPKRCNLLHDSLNDLSAVVWLTPAVDAPGLLSQLRAGAVAKHELSSLVDALQPILSGKGGRIGRPWGRGTYVIRAGCIAWCRAGRHAKYIYNSKRKRLTGPLPDFLRDFFDSCELPHPSDDALKESISACKNDGLFRMEACKNH